MEIKDLPKVNKEKELSEEQKNDLFGNIIRGKDVTEKIETSRGTFEVKFPRMKDLETIGRLLARRLNGVAVTSMDPGIYSIMSMVATLDVIIISGPAWYENAKKSENGFSWAYVPNQSYIQEVYALAFEFREKIEKLLEQDKGDSDSRVDSKQYNFTSDEPGIFEGMSGSSGSSR